MSDCKECIDIKTLKIVIQTKERKIEKLKNEIEKWKMECCDWQDYNTKLQTEIEKATSGFVMERDDD